MRKVLTHYEVRTGCLATILTSFLKVLKRKMDVCQESICFCFYNKVLGLLLSSFSSRFSCFHHLKENIWKERRDGRRWKVRERAWALESETLSRDTFSHQWKPWANLSTCLNNQTPGTNLGQHCARGPWAHSAEDTGFSDLLRLHGEGVMEPAPKPVRTPSQPTASPVVV